ncbi:MAG: GNAT family N-acetyltransferase [Verrucomicrobiota bacterium]
MSFEHDDDLVELKNLFVTRNRLSQGMGRQLLDYAIQLARDRRHRRMKIISDPHAKRSFLT